MDDVLVKVVVPPGGNSMGARLFAADGVEIKGVMSVDISLSAGEPVIAKVGLLLRDGFETDAHPLLTEETLRRSAGALGYSLMKVGCDPDHSKRSVKGRYHIDEDGAAWIDVGRIANTASRWEGPYILVSPCVGECDRPLSQKPSDHR